MPERSSLMTEAITERMVIGLAMARHREPCSRHHFDGARKLGVSVEDMRKAVNMGLSVRPAPHRLVVETAERCLRSGASEGEAVPCCSGEGRG